METGIAPPDGAEDLARRRKRAGEFSNRFSRIYLYQLGRQVSVFLFYVFIVELNQKILFFYGKLMFE